MAERANSSSSSSSSSPSNCFKIVGTYDAEKYKQRIGAEGLYTPVKEARDANSEPTYLEGARRYAIKKYGYPMPVIAKEVVIGNKTAIGSKTARVFVTGSYTELYYLTEWTHRPLYSQKAPAMLTVAFRENEDGTSSGTRVDNAFHEVIDHDEPCNLYYDLDVVYDDIDQKWPGHLYKPVELLLKFQMLIAKCASELLNVNTHHLVFYQCEACSAEKFSVHGVVRGMPAFASSDDVRQFMLYAKKRSRELRTAVGDDPQNTVPMWDILGPVPKNGKNKDAFVADMAVYAKNHTLRLLGTTKQLPPGKKAPNRYLIPVGYAEDDANGKNGVPNYTADLLAKHRMYAKSTGHFDISMEQFRNYMVQYIESDTPIVQLSIPGLSSMTGADAGRALPSAWYPKDAILMERLLVEMERLTSVPAEDKTVKFARARFRSLPGPALRVRVDTVGTYCPLLRRKHKGNHQYAVIDFQRNGFHMQCYSPKCAGMREPYALAGSFELLMTALRTGQPIKAPPPPLTVAMSEADADLDKEPVAAEDEVEQKKEENEEVDYDSDFPVAEPAAEVVPNRAPDKKIKIKKDKKIKKRKRVVDGSIDDQYKGKDKYSKRDSELDEPLVIIGEADSCNSSYSIGANSDSE